jgi:hypothetical protein
MNNRECESEKDIQVSFAIRGGYDPEKSQTAKKTRILGPN